MNILQEMHVSAMIRLVAHSYCILLKHVESESVFPKKLQKLLISTFMIYFIWKEKSMHSATCHINWPHPKFPLKAFISVAMHLPHMGWEQVLGTSVGLIDSCICIFIIYD